MGLSAAALAADIEAARSDMTTLTGSLVSTEATPRTVSVTLSPIRKEDDVQEIGVFHGSDLEAVGVLTDYSNSTPPQAREVVLVTCSALGLSSTRFGIESLEVDPGGFRMMLKRKT